MTKFELQQVFRSIIKEAKEISIIELKLKIFREQYNKTTQQITLSKIKKLEHQKKQSEEKINARIEKAIVSILRGF